jgi:UDP-3-O-[3-hydroxymyristoyl] glucosamine N-acyltransferase
VIIGNHVKIQNNASIFHRAIIEDGVFIDPHACLDNDKIP